MGMLVDGVWHDVWYSTKESKGRFVRSESQFRHQISEKGEFKPESGRYHLYVANACPWAHRALIFRKIKKLESHISVSVVHPHMLEHGWTFKKGYNDSIVDHLYGFDYLHQVYTKADPGYSGRVTVPILWDKKTETIVNNESSEIIRIFNQEFNSLTGDNQDFYPMALRDEIDKVNARVYDSINNGVYKAGFATTQDAYNEAVNALFDSLDWVETLLSQEPYLVGGVETEADWRLFPTLVRFDLAYYGHFKCNIRQIHDYPFLSAYVNKMYNHEGIAETVNFEQIKEHYYYSHHMINPTRIVPAGPDRFLP